MLNEDPSQRPSLPEVISSKWMAKEFSPEILELTYMEMNSRKEFMQAQWKSQANKRV